MIGKHVNAVAIGFCAFVVHLIVCQRFRPQYSYNSGNAQNLPNPAVNVTECQMSGSSRICDLYDYLTASREGLNDALRNLEGLKPGEELGSATECLCNRYCKFPTVVMVALHLREIGPDLTDPRGEAEAMAKKLRDRWQLGGCSVVFFSSTINVMSYSGAGSKVNHLLNENKTKEIDEYVHQTYAIRGLFERAINETIYLYRKLLLEVVTEEEIRRCQKEVGTLNEKMSYLRIEVETLEKLLMKSKSTATKSPIGKYLLATVIIVFTVGQKFLALGV